eukprot:TRINITY_DN2563_c0_g1_i1.p1 TRINITY_DN2563_c0_g1~~TRINITY_DN2563_c0_g1_i1.p1  ORF type:complete len:59 (+),score=2.24 TRINITY_DN2563_c0_g1_i1:370-546(+)
MSFWRLKTKCHGDIYLFEKELQTSFDPQKNRKKKQEGKKSLSCEIRCLVSIIQRSVFN